MLGDAEVDSSTIGGLLKIVGKTQMRLLMRVLENPLAFAEAHLAKNGWDAGSHT